MSAANQPTDLPTLVFDLDGTLADTAVDLIGTLNVLMKRMGAPEVPVDRASDVVGAGARAMIQRGLALGGRTVSDEHRGAFPGLPGPLRREPRRQDRALSRRTGGARPARLAGYRLAVCTNKPEEHSIRLLAALGVADRFGSICGRDTFAYAKPDPRHLTLTVEKAGGDPGHAIMIGDSRTDVDTARAAGLPVIAVSFGYTDTPVEKLGPDRVVDHFDELESAILRLPAADGGRRLIPISARERRNRGCSADPAPIASTLNTTSTDPAFSNTSVALTFSPLTSGFASPISITCSPPGFNSTLPPAGISMPAARGRIVMTPFVMAISCSSLTGDASLVTETSRSGAVPRFSIVR